MRTSLAIIIVKGQKTGAFLSFNLGCSPVPLQNLTSGFPIHPALRAIIQKAPNLRCGFRFLRTVTFAFTGYSFGARISASVVSKGCHIEDDIAPKNLVKKHIDGWEINPKYKIKFNIDKFYIAIA